jgi:hypothetical protein
MTASDARDMFNDVVSPGDLAIEMTRITGGEYEFMTEQGRQLLEFLVVKLTDEEDE